MMVKKWPFFLVVDDGGFPSTDPGKHSVPITMRFYENILRLATTYGMRIPVCFTMRFLDINHISPEAAPLPYAKELITFIQENEENIEFGYHGLTHEYEGKPVEFFDIYTNSKVPSSFQSSHINESFQIIKSLSLPQPEIFVPPSHAWESGVTDKLLSQYGIKYLISCPELRFAGLKYIWNSSSFLIFLPRGTLRIYHNDINLDSGIVKRTRLGVVKVDANWAKKFICPRNIYYNLRFKKRLSALPTHSYMTHIGNFSDHAMGFWHEVFDFVMKREDIHVCKSNVEAQNYYTVLSKGRRRNG